MSSGTFVDACLKGTAFLSDIDDWVDQWHDGLDSRSLDAFLGFSPDEGRLWAEKPSSLGAIVAARKDRVDVREILNQRDFALAARSVRPADARDALDWLIAHGRVSAR